MLDIKLIRNNPEMVRENLRRRGKPEYLEMLEELIKNDKEYRKLKQEDEEKKHLKNLLAKKIGKEKGEQSTKMNKELKLIIDEVIRKNPETLKLLNNGRKGTK